MFFRKKKMLSPVPAECCVCGYLGISEGGYDADQDMAVWPSRDGISYAQTTTRLSSHLHLPRLAPSGFHLCPECFDVLDEASEDGTLREFIRACINTHN